MTVTADPDEPVLYRFRFGSAEFDESRLQLRVHDAVVDLEHRPLRVLSELLRHAGEVVTRKHLFREVWANRTDTPEVLTNAIAKLRKALGSADGEHVVTVPRIGYRLDGVVERIEIDRQQRGGRELSPGRPVPLRENFVLEALLGRSPGKEVWQARQAQTGELRVFKFGLDGDQLAELEREAQLYRALRATLGDRDDIERVIDWNFESDPFFLECEHGGVDLVAWTAAPGRWASLTRSMRLALFLRIADAVAAAHSVGVLHKNLKPGKVLIAPRADGGLHVRVTDFGGGRLLDPGMLEALGIEGPGAATDTVPAPGGADASRRALPYVAPEVIGGAPATLRSDVYSLGLMLYQIVVGDLQRPMAPGWELGLEDDLLAADIAAATDGDPRRRIETIAALAGRLRDLDARRLARARQQQVERRAAAAEQVLQRARLRRPWLIVAAVSLVVGAVTSLVFYERERAARLQAEAARSRAEAINNFLSDDLLASADPSNADGYAGPTMHQVLQRAAQRLDARFADEPATKATIELSISQAYYGLSDYAQAEAHARRAIALLEGSVGAGDPLTLLADYRLAVVLSQHDHLDDAGHLLDRADQAAGARIAGDTPLAFQAHWARANYYKLRFAIDKSLAEFVAADRVRSVTDPGNPVLDFRVKQGLSWCYLRQGKNALAEQTLRPLMAPAFTVERVGAGAWSQVRLDDGAALMALGRTTEAESGMSDALRMLRTALGPDHFYVGLAQNFLGDLYASQSRWVEAADSVGDANRIFRLSGGAHAQAALVSAANLGILDEYAGRMPQAIETLSSTHDGLVASLGAASPQTQAVAFYLAVALQDTGAVADARRVAAGLTARDLAAAEPRDDWPARLDALLGAILVREGRSAQGAPQLARAVESMKRGKTPAADIQPFEKALASADPGSR